MTFYRLRLGNLILDQLYQSLYLITKLLNRPCYKMLTQLFFLPEKFSGNFEYLWFYRFRRARFEFSQCHLVS